MHYIKVYFFNDLSLASIRIPVILIDAASNSIAFRYCKLDIIDIQFGKHGSKVVKWYRLGSARFGYPAWLHALVVATLFWDLAALSTNTLTANMLPQVRL